MFHFCSINTLLYSPNDIRVSDMCELCKLVKFLNLQQAAYRAE